MFYNPLPTVLQGELCGGKENELEDGVSNGIESHRGRIKNWKIRMMGLKDAVKKLLRKK